MTSERAGQGTARLLPDEMGCTRPALESLQPSEWRNR